MLPGPCEVGNVTLANARSGQDIRFVRQLKVDGLRADLLNRYQASFGKDGFQ